MIKKAADTLWGHHNYKVGSAGAIAGLSLCQQSPVPRMPELRTYLADKEIQRQAQFIGTSGFVIFSLLLSACSVYLG